MKKVICTEIDCILMKDGQCAAGELRIEDGQCASFVSYRSLPEYGEKFWRLMKRPSGGMKRIGALGRRIEFGELTFYTRDNIGAAAVRLTEARTGVLCGFLSNLRDNYEVIKEKLRLLPDVTEYEDGGMEEDA